MCFMIMDPWGRITNALNSRLEFYFYFPSALKLHSSTYNLLDSISTKSNSIVPSDEKSTSELTVYFQRDYFRLKQPNHIGEELANDIQSHFQKLVERIGNYESTPFESFFWSAASTKQFFTIWVQLSNEAELKTFQRDLNTNWLWSTAATEFDEIIGKNGEKKLRDFCNFDSMLKGFKIREVSRFDTIIYIE